MTEEPSTEPGEAPNEVPSEVPSFKPAHFPVVRITGGPAGRNTEIMVDGKPVEKAFGFELTGKVNDLIRLTTHQFIVADVEISMAPVAIVDGGFNGMVRLKGSREVDGQWYADDHVLVEAGGCASVPQLLRLMADAIEERQMQNVTLTVSKVLAPEDPS